LTAAKSASICGDSGCLTSRHIVFADRSPKSLHPPLRRIRMRARATVPETALSLHGRQRKPEF
jgi:hypothetical protein